MSLSLSSLLCQNILTDLIQSKITIHFIGKPKIYDSDTKSSYEGQFISEDKVLEVATCQSTEDFILTFIHEYCHFLQWRDHYYLFRKSSKDLLIFERFLNIRKLTNRVNAAINLVQQLELNCEKRVIALLESYKIDCNYDLYIQKSNAYILFYAVIKHTKKWYKHNPAVIKQILDVMPTTFQSTDWYQHVDDDMIRLYRKYVCTN